MEMKFFVKLNGSTIGTFETIEDARVCMFENENSLIDTQQYKPEFNNDFSDYSMRRAEGANHADALSLSNS